MTDLERLSRLETQYQELADIIEQLAKDLELASVNLHHGLKGQRAETQPQQTTIDKLLPPELTELLTVTTQGEYVTLKPRQFLGSEAFAKIASAVKAAGGEYVSAGRDSHFRILSKLVKT